ncbi:MAG: CotH kinase family protein [Clostridia bacterium]|nr:CotH kinase family protein [Clostridia bacterium]
MIKKLLPVALIFLALVMCMTGCDGAIDTAVNSNLGTIIDKSEINTEENVHIRDKNLIYEQQNNTEIVTMYLTVSRGNTAENTDHTWEEINTYSAYDYEEMGVERYKVAGLIQIGDENGLIPGELGYGQVAPNCTVQIRGQSSSRNVQKNYKISIKDNKGDWRGQKTIALNKHQGDGLRFRNKLGFDLLSGIDELLSLRTTFVRLYVKDTTAGADAKFEDYGIYTQVEQLNKTALERHGLDKRGHLYKINFCEFYRYEDTIVLKEDPRYDIAKFEEILEIKGDDDHTKLIHLLERINDYSIPIETILREDFDIENITYWMAYQLLTGNVDTQSRNFYLYSAKNDDRWYILSWDLDGSFKRMEYELLGRNDYAEWEAGVSNYWGNVLFKRCLKSEYYREELSKAVDDFFARLCDGRVEEYASSYASLLKPLVYIGRDALYMPVTQAQYDIIATTLVEEIKSNYQRFKDSFEKPMPFFIGVPQKNDSNISLIWEASYAFDAEAISYSFELATDYKFENPILKIEDLKIPAVEFEHLPEGQYFIRVMANDAGGQTQTAFDSYMTSGGKIYGTKCFYVDANGQIVEDVYVED